MHFIVCVCVLLDFAWYAPDNETSWTFEKEFKPVQFVFSSYCITDFIEIYLVDIKLLCSQISVLVAIGCTHISTWILCCFIFNFAVVANQWRICQKSMHYELSEFWSNDICSHLKMYFSRTTEFHFQLWILAAMQNDFFEIFDQNS